MSTTQEYYIRRSHEPDARGPFSLEQLASLCENGQVDPDTLYYEAATENWTAISTNTTLYETLFPAKKNLRVRSKSDAQIRNLNQMTESDRAITVGDMLLAAEGRTADTKGAADPAINQGRAARIGLYAAMATLVITAAAYLLPSIDIVVALDLPGILGKPLVLLGFLNLALGLCLLLGAIAAYPYVRFAAMLGLGFTGTVYYLDGQMLPLAFSVAASVGLYFCTIFLNLPAVLLAALLGVVGACGLAQVLFST